MITERVMWFHRAHLRLSFLLFPWLIPSLSSYQFCFQINPKLCYFLPCSSRNSVSVFYLIAWFQNYPFYFHFWIRFLFPVMCPITISSNGIKKKKNQNGSFLVLSSLGRLQQQLYIRYTEYLLTFLSKMPARDKC